MGPWIGGLPHDGQGFLATDAHGAVLGIEAVWAAGDGTAFPLKQGGLAAQQAGAAASAIARSLGADVPAGALPSRPARDAARSGRPALPGLHARRPADDAAVVAADQGRRTAPLRRTSPRARPHVPADSEEIDVGELLLGLAERHATLGENALALRCLDAAVQVRGALPPEAAARRDELAGAPLSAGAGP